MAPLLGTVVVVAPPPGPVVVVAPPPGPVVVVVDSAAGHNALVMVLVSNVAAPLRASVLPSIVAPVVIVIDVKARTVPVKIEFVPSVAELPTCQKTLQGCSAADEAHPTGRGRRERGTSLEDEDGVLVALGVEGEGSGQSERGRGLVDAR